MKADNGLTSDNEFYFNLHVVSVDIFLYQLPHYEKKSFLPHPNIYYIRLTVFNANLNKF